jgi:FkbM family methyltransferase
MNSTLNLGTTAASSSTPVLFKLAKMLQHRNMRGAYRVLHALRRYWKHSLPVYALSSQISLAVPIGRKEHCWDLEDLLSYEKELINLFCESVDRLTNVTLIDCGADIGLFSALVCAQSQSICRILAFEPNPEIQGVFQRNIVGLPNGTPYALAVSNFTGFGKLEQPTYDNSDHARYIVPTQAGIPVVTIDSLNLSCGNLAIKIDVEGGELNVIRGAQETIRNAAECVLTLEVHPAVCRRTGIGPAESVWLLESIRPFRFTVAETGETFHQAGNLTDTNAIRNLVCVTDGR